MEIKRRAPQSKKHKTWQGDGVLVVTKPKGVLMDLEGRMYALIFFLFGVQEMRLAP
jgi:hypothetical protein